MVFLFIFALVIKTKTKMTTLKSDYILHLQNTLIHLYNVGNYEMAKRVQADIKAELKKD